MEVGRKNFKNDNIHDQDLDVVPEWQISVGRKKFEAVEQQSAAEEVADAQETAAAAETADAVAGGENDQEEEVNNDSAQEVN